MANHHLRNQTLSLKSKGLLSQMLSLPENWDYTLRGLAKINRECVDAIREAVRELEAAGYIVRDHRKRNRNGQFQGASYTIYERPVVSQTSPEKESPVLEKPVQEKPMLENPTQVNPIQEKPTLANPTQLNTKITNTKSSNTNGLNIDPSNPYQSNSKAATGSEVDAMRSDIHEITSIRQSVRNKMEYDYLIHKFDQTRLDEIVEIITEVLCSDRKHITVSGESIPAQVVKNRLQLITDEHIVYIFDSLGSTRSRIKNIKKYLLAALYNAPQTINSYYTALVNHDDHHASSFMDRNDDTNGRPERRNFT